MRLRGVQHQLVTTRRPQPLRSTARVARSLRWARHLGRVPIERGAKSTRAGVDPFSLKTIVCRFIPSRSVYLLRDCIRWSSVIRQSSAPLADALFPIRVCFLCLHLFPMPWANRRLTRLSYGSEQYIEDARFVTSRRLRWRARSSPSIWVTNGRHRGLSAFGTNE